jgi:hypothetical protein
MKKVHVKIPTLLPCFLCKFGFENFILYGKWIISKSIHGCYYIYIEKKFKEPEFFVKENRESITRFKSF